MNLPENIWNSPVIRNRLYAEACFEDGWGAKHYWVVVPEGDTGRGFITLKNYKEDFLKIDPHELQKLFAEELQGELQRNLHNNGLWIVGWTNPPAPGEVVREDGDNAWERLFMVWLDQDADPQYTFESTVPFVEMAANGARYYVDKCAECHEKYVEAYGKRALKDDFGISESQQTKKTLISLNS